MKLGFNEGCNRFCKGQSVAEDIALCEKYGFELIDVQSECLDRDLAEGKYTLEQLAEVFAKSKVKMASYNALCGFNMNDAAGRKAVLEQLTEIVRRCGILNCDTIVLVPAMDLKTPATRKTIREDAVSVIREMLAIVEPKGIRLSLEFCGLSTMSINRFEDAYAIVQAVDSPLVGITLDEYQFTAMGSDWQFLEESDGSRIFVWHLNGMEDMPCGAAYNNDTIRLWPGAEGDCINHARIAAALKKIGYSGDNCIVEVFRPAYYELENEENIRQAAEAAKAHVAKYWN